MKRHALCCWVLTVLLFGCGGRDQDGSKPDDSGKTAAPITIRIQNPGVSAIFLGGNGTLFELRDAAGNGFKSGPSHIEAFCDQCDMYCGLVIDPLRTYIEIPAGKELSEEVLVYQEVPSGCACDDYDALDCYGAVTLPQGQYTFEVAYTDSLDLEASWQRLRYNDELWQWVESDQMGLAVLPLKRSIPVRLDGKSEVVLTLGE